MRLNRPRPRSRRRAGIRINSSARIAVVGGGSWGTALAVQFARAGRETSIWAREPAQSARMADERSNERYLPGVAFPEKLRVAPDLGAAAEGADIVLLVVPSNAFRRTLEALAETRVELRGLAWATKGFELGSGLLPHQVVADVLSLELPTAVLAGPTFAREVGAGLPSALTIASTNTSYALAIAEAITTTSFRAYTSTDIVGVEVGGATKNVFAIGAGISDGLGFGANTRIALLTRGLSRAERLVLLLSHPMEYLMIRPFGLLR